MLKHYSDEFKKQAVDYYIDLLERKINGEKWLTKVGNVHKYVEKKFKIPYNSVARWKTDLYPSGKLYAFRTQELKLKIVKEYKELVEWNRGLPRGEKVNCEKIICEQYGVSSSQISFWRRGYYLKCSSTLLANRDIIQKYAHLSYLQAKEKLKGEGIDIKNSKYWYYMKGASSKKLYKNVQES